MSATGAPTPPPPGETKPSGEAQAPEAAAPDVVWSFRGYKLRASEFNTAMVHLFRAEVQRANVWRQRLDTTTNWAVVTTGASISFAFSQTQSLHYVLALNVLLVTMFLYIEARRYRYYELWSYRVRLMETDFFAAMLVPPFHPCEDWAEALAENLLHPHFPISYWEAAGRRLRRNYLWIYTVMGAAWIAKLWLQPVPVSSFANFVQRAKVGAIPGEWVLAGTLLFFVSLIVLSVATLRMQDAAGEVLPRYGGAAAAALHSLSPSGAPIPGEASKERAWFRPSRHRQQLLTFIVTERAKAIADLVLKEMRRGVTGLNATGMYTGQERTVLMCALTATEVPHLKALVTTEDPNAFIIVAPAQEVLGKGFIPLNVPNN